MTQSFSEQTVSTSPLSRIRLVAFVVAAASISTLMLLGGPLRPVDTTAVLNAAVVVAAGIASVGLGRSVKSVHESRVTYQPDDAYMLALLLLLGGRNGAALFVVSKGLATLLLLERPNRVLFGSGDFELRFTKWLANFAAFAVSTAPAAFVAEAIVRQWPTIAGAFLAAVVGSLVYAVSNTVYLAWVMSRVLDLPYAPVGRSLLVDTLVEERWLFLGAAICGFTIWAAPAAVPLAIGGLLVFTVARKRIYLLEEQSHHYRDLFTMSASAVASGVSSTHEQIVQQLRVGAATALTSGSAELRHEPPADDGTEAGVQMSDDPDGNARWLVVGDHLGKSIYGGNDMAMLRSIAEVGQQALDAASERELLKDSSTRDALTGLLNRYGMELELKALDGDDEQSVIVFDLDRFDHFNSVYGPSAGDTVLFHVARRLRDVFGECDIARDGDQFMVLAGPDVTQNVAATADIALAVLAKPIRTNDGIRVRTSATGAVLTFRGNDDVEKQRLFRVAERTLTDLKRQGRGRLKTVALSGWGSAVKFKDLPEVNEGPQPGHWATAPSPDIAAASSTVAASTQPAKGEAAQDQPADSATPADSDTDTDPDGSDDAPASA